MTLGFLILGPFEVHLDGVPLALGGRQQRSLLAALTLRANELVSSERLIDELWPEDPPDTADHLVHVYISRLRKALGEAGRTILVTRPPGYELVIERGQLDLHRFDDLMASARTSTEDGKLEQASEQLRAALALWRGPALADLVSESFARADAERLNEQRLSATEDLMRSELAAGQTDLIPELKSLVTQHPLRERLHGLLMVALYREGRQAEALDEYESTRALLADQLGIDPSEELQELHRRVLVQDPTLFANVPNIERDTGTVAPILADRQRRAGIVVAGVAVTLVLAVSGLIALHLGSGDGGTNTSGSEVSLFTGADAGAMKTVDLAGAASGVAADQSEVWVADDGAGTITRIPMDTLTPDPAVSSGIEPVSITAGDGRAWILDPYAGQIKALDASGQVDDGFVWRSPSPVDAVYVQGYLWVVDAACGCLFKLDASTGHLRQKITEPFVGAGPSRVDAGPGGIWVLDGIARSLVRIAPWNGEMVGTPIALSGQPTDLAVSSDTIWVSMEADDIVERLSPTGALQADVPVPGGPSAIVADADGAWVLTSRRGRLVRLVGSSATLVPFGASPTGLAIDDTGAWVSSAGG